MILKNRNRWNKRGLEDSLFTWIGAFVFIVFFMTIYIVFLLAIFSEKEITKDVNVVFEESNVDLNLNKRFLDFLGTEINEDEKIIEFLIYI